MSCLKKIKEDKLFNQYLVHHYKKGAINKSNNDGGNNQKLKLLSLGKAISGAPINNGIKKLPNPPRRIGIITKKKH